MSVSFMKEYLVHLLLAFSTSTAFATNYGYDRINTFGNVVVVENPYMIDHRLQYPFGLDWQFDVILPELAEMCAVLMNTSPAQFIKTGADIGVIKGPGRLIAVFDQTSKIFSVVADPASRINSMDSLMCQLPTGESNLYGTFTTLPDGSTRIDQPKIKWDDRILPMEMPTYDAEAFCKFHGFQSLVTAVVNYELLDGNFEYQKLNLIDDPYRIYVEVTYSKGDQRFHEMLDSITCK